MQPAPSNQTAALERLHHISRACALAVLLLGLACLGGWAFNVELLKSALPGFAAMKPNAALAFVLAGCALALHRRHKWHKWPQLACAALVVLIGGLTLAQDVGDVDFGIDQLLFREAAGAVQTIHQGRMSPITATALILFGASLALLGSRRAAQAWVSEALALLALALALPALIGYAYGSVSFYPLPGFGSMALHTTLPLPLLGLGILCARADGLVGALVKPGLGGQVARRLAAQALIAPLLLGALLQMSEHAGLFYGVQNIAVFAAVMMLLLVLVLLSGRLARTLELADAHRQQADSAHARLAMIVESTDDAVISKSMDGAVLTWNVGAEHMFSYTAAEIIGRTDALLIPSDRWQAEEQILQRLRRGEAVASYDTVRLTKDGRAIDVAVTVSALKDAAGRVVGLAKILRDIGARKRAELALQISEERLRLAADAAELGIWTWQPDADGILWANCWPAEILGVAATDAPVNGARFAAEFVHPDDRADFQRALAATLQGGARLFFEGRFYRPDGCMRWIELTGQPQPGPSGPCERVIGTVRDITERKQAEQTLARQAVELNSLYATAPVGLFMFDTELRYVRINRVMAELNGLPAELHIGRPLRDVLAPELADAVEPQLRHVLATGRPVLNIEVSGSTLPKPDEQRHWLLSSHPVLDDQGALCGVQGAVQDITERLRAEAALRTSEQRLRAFITASSDAVYRMSPDWRVMHRLHGQDFIKDSAAPNAHWMQEYILPDDRVRVTAAVDEAIRTKSMFELEHRVLRADASIGWTFSHALPLLDANGEITEWFGTASDVTDYKRAEAALRESEARYRALFESIDEGFCVIDMLFDEQDKAIDYRFLEVNPAFEKHTGLHAATGKRMLELNPEHEASWFEIYGQVALSGEPIRFTHEARALCGRWFDVYALRLGGPETSKVALLFRDITAAKRSEDDLRESNQELIVFNLAAVGRELRMIELKHEINALCALTGLPARFALAGDEPPHQQ